MKLIQPNCRLQFTAEDVAFMIEVLGNNSSAGQTQCLVDLLGDGENLDLLLDDPALYHALLEKPLCLRVSAHFYFYVMVRQTLLRVGLCDRRVADYVAEVLAEFTATDRQACTVRREERPLEYFFEMVDALRRVDERMRFLITAHIGNLALLLTGLFHERVHYRAARRGFPDLGYYREMGRAHFRLASDHRLAERYDLSSVLKVLAEQFDGAQRALNDLADRIFCFEAALVPVLCLAEAPSTPGQGPIHGVPPPPCA